MNRTIALTAAAVACISLIASTTIEPVNGFLKSAGIDLPLLAGMTEARSTTTGQVDALRDELPSSLPDHYGVYVQVDDAWVEVNANTGFTGSPKVGSRLPRLLIFDKRVADKMNAVQLVNLHWVTHFSSFTNGSFGRPEAKTEAINDWRVVTQQGVKTFVIDTISKPVADQDEMVVIEPTQELYPAAYAYTTRGRAAGGGELFKFVFGMPGSEEAQYRPFQCAFLQQGKPEGGWNNWFALSTEGVIALPCNGVSAALALDREAEAALQKNDVGAAVALKRAAFDQYESIDSRALTIPFLKAPLLLGRAWARILMDKNLDSALADIEEAQSLDEHNEMRYLEAKAYVLFRLERLTDATSVVDKIIGAVVDSPAKTFWGSAVYLRGLIKMRNGNNVGGLNDLSDAEQLYPTITANREAFGLADPSQGHSRTLAAAAEKCFSRAVMPDVAPFTVRLRVGLNADGSVTSTPVPVDKTANESVFVRATLDSAIRAVRMCAPYQFGDAPSAQWKELTVTFSSHQ